ncbi:DUF421 domain-containing protein [Cohnella terricola]|uniref:DUF421 domain-containing protein n=1 Tax=Cohnella terricola TaxID=1289167 RepID=UPI001FE55F40|nr:YetF domain-containing protein [Cohnella terricola]
MKVSFIWEAMAILFVGFCLLRILGKKTVGEMTGLEIITLLAMASHIGHAIPGDGLLKTIIVLSTFVALLLVIQYLSVKFNKVEKLFMGEAAVVIKDGQIQTDALKRLRMSVDQLEARLRENSIMSFEDVKTATIEISGQLGYELKRQAKPVTIGELEKILAPLLMTKAPPQPQYNLFKEVREKEHDKEIPKNLQ